MPSAADAYAAAMERGRRSRSKLGAFESLYPFGLDAFQREACAALEGGSSVLVAAPTGSGKTVVGEFAIHLALESGRKCFYTTPIKALSNQKYRDLVARYGEQRIGLLTGDNSVNGEAPIVVMTTEVLRNMLYSGSRTLADLGYVVMDEVHYLADRFRGPVWEEVIIHLPESVTVVALSATVSNAEEFGAWLAEVRGRTQIVLEEHRPVPLWQHVMAGHRMLDLFIDEDQEVVNPELVRLARGEDRQDRQDRQDRRGRRGRSRHAPLRTDVVEELQRDGLLPAIYFLFSRAGCDDAVRQCLDAGLRLNTREERSLVSAEVLEATRMIPDGDLVALGFGEWREGLERGIAAHHAGLLPAFKEVVERLFQRGLIKAVFATETLALGINMPARCVVLEKLVKWNGEAHVDLTPGEYTQLTGRAGRRGIDVEGHGVVLWHDGLDPRALAGLASTRTYPLRSSFRPTYNMAVNLVSQMGRHTAREILETSFAQFQADRSVVGLATQMRRIEEGIEGYREAMSCHLGDFEEYARLRDDLGQLEKSLTRDAAARRRDDARESLRRLRVGDVVVIPGGRRAGSAVVIEASDADEPRPVVLTGERQVRRLSSGEVSTPLEPIDRMRIPKGFSARSAQSRRDLASALRERAGDRPVRPRRSDGRGEDDRVARLRQEIRQHACHGCADREAHARWAERLHRAERERRDLEQRVEGRTNSIARRFDRVCEVLAELGYLTTAQDDARVTIEGQMLMRLYTESDLLVAECLREGLWRELGAEDLAAVCSALLYESRAVEESPRLPRGPSCAVLESMASMRDALHEREQRHGLDITRPLDVGFAWAAHRWAGGATLSSLLATTDLTAGDFVRWTRQLIDLLGQIAQALPEGDPVRGRAREAAARLDRGVVGYASGIEA